MEDLERNMSEIEEYQQLLDSDKDSDFYKLESQRKHLFRISGTRTLSELDYWIQEQERLYSERQSAVQEIMSPEKKRFMENIVYVLSTLQERRKEGIHTPIVFWH